MQNNFKIGVFYKLQEIRAVFGGPLLASIATKNNEVLYVKFKAEKLNPNLPSEVWIKNGPIQVKSALSWVNSGKEVPLFFKSTRVGNPNWKYIGNSRASILCQGTDAEIFTKSKEIGLVLRVDTIFKD